MDPFNRNKFLDAAPISDEMRELCGLAPARGKPLGESYTHSQLRKAAWSAIHRLEPRKTRIGTLRGLAAQLAKQQVVLGAFHARMQDGKLDYHASMDLVGEVLMDWKESYEIEDNDKYEDLSMDLNKYMEPYLKKYMPDQAASHSALQAHYAPIIQKAEFLVNLLRDLSTGHAPAFKEGTAGNMARDLAKMIG